MLMYRGKIRCSVSLDILEKGHKFKHYSLVLKEIYYIKDFNHGWVVRSGGARNYSNRNQYYYTYLVMLRDVQELDFIFKQDG